MGDRGHVYVEPADEAAGVYLYSHWGGSSLPTTVADALDRGRGRWNDEPYLARIIFSEMIKEDVNGETGYGISARVTDTGDGHRVVHVNVWDQTVVLEVRGRCKEYTFEAFVKERPQW